jgi:lipoprotein-anchoring transpeptidase ErfK/SrfK
MALAAALALMVPLLSGRAGAADSSVYIVHGIPGVPVDVYAGGTDPANKVLSDFTYGTVTPALTLPAGDLPVLVVKAGLDPTDPANVLITQTLTVPSGANVSVAADLVGGAPVLTPFVNDVSAVPEGSSRVTVRHAADAPAVNVLVNGQVAIPNLAAGAQASAVLPAGTYDIQVQLTDGTPLPALSPGSVTIPAAKNVIVYATGSATNQTFPLGLVQQVIDVPTTAATTTTAPPAAQGVTATPAVTG